MFCDMAYNTLCQVSRVSTWLHNTCNSVRRPQKLGALPSQFLQLEGVIMGHDTKT
jgi:hypothetical protein